jgi:hypothetical protein
MHPQTMRTIQKNQIYLIINLLNVTLIKNLQCDYGSKVKIRRMRMKYHVSISTSSYVHLQGLSIMGQGPSNDTVNSGFTCFDADHRQNTIRKTYIFH